MRILGAAAAAVLTLTMFSSVAQTYPTGNVVFISGAAGAVETLLRPMFDRVKQNTGATFVFELRAGGDGAPALQALKRAKPDGYTFGVTYSAAILNTIANAELGIDPLKDFEAVTDLWTTISFVVAREDFRADDMRDVVAMAKANPGSLRFGVASLGQRVWLKILEERAGVKLLQVPYRSSNETAIAILGGHIDISSMALGGLVGQKGKLKALAYGGATRSPQLPSVPTMREMYQFDMMTGGGSVLAPAGTQAAAVNWVNRELVRVMNAPEIMKLIASVGLFPIGNSPDEYASSLRAQVSENRELLRKYPDVR